MPTPPDHAVPSGVLDLLGLDAFEAQQDTLIAHRLQAVAWELLRFWEAFPEVDTIVLSALAPSNPEASSSSLDLEWSMRSNDGRDRLEEYVLHRPVGDSRWDRAHAQTGSASPYGAWATNRLRRWGIDEHRSVRDLLNDVWALPDGLHRANPVEPLMHLLEQHLPGSQHARSSLAAAWGQEAQAWCVIQEQHLLHSALVQENPEANEAEASRPRNRL